MRTLLVFAYLGLATASASAGDWIIGDNDGYAMGVPDGALHAMPVPYDGRSAAEAAATNGAQFTDTFSTSHPGYGPADQGTVSTFRFTGLGTGWSEAFLRVDMADFQASALGAVAVTYNGIAQDWSFNDGAGNTRIRYFTLAGPVLDSINATGELVIVVDRAGSRDLYAFDYMQLLTVPTIPEPRSLVLMGLGVAGLAFRRRA